MHLSILTDAPRAALGEHLARRLPRHTGHKTAHQRLSAHNPGGESPQHDARTLVLADTKALRPFAPLPDVAFDAFGARCHVGADITLIHARAPLNVSAKQLQALKVAIGQLQRRSPLAFAVGDHKADYTRPSDKVTRRAGTLLVGVILAAVLYAIAGPIAGAIGLVGGTMAAHASDYIHPQRRRHFHHLQYTYALLRFLSEDPRGDDGTRWHIDAKAKRR